MLPTKLCRRTYPGSDRNHGYKITSMKFTSFGDKQYKCQNVSVIEDYNTGCKLHPDCFGHMCVTPSGIPLIPQSASLKVGVIRTEYEKASIKAFDDNMEEYIQSLRRTNYSKYGRLRRSMTTPIAGSARLVTVPQNTYPMHVVCISEELCRSIRYCKRQILPTGECTDTFVETSLKENDYCILLRPPSLNITSVQPVMIKYWKYHAMGVHTELYTQMHGDYDGDEAHIYPLSNPLSIEEAKNWIHNNLKPFDLARQKILQVIPSYNSTEYSLDFIKYTTLSTKQIYDGNITLFLGDETRNPTKHLTGTTKRFQSDTTEIDFFRESIRGVTDIMTQQLSQSQIGEMSRIARIAASCFYRNDNGKLMCNTSTGQVLLDNTPVLDAGIPSCRAVMAFCSKSQQSRLDAHRVGSDNFKGFDVITDVLIGISSTNDSSTYVTLCIFEGLSRDVIRTFSTWSTTDSNEVVCLLNPSHIPPQYVMHVTGAYSPRILCKIDKELRVSRCMKMLTCVAQYCDVEIYEDECLDLAYCLSYMPHKSSYPTTTRRGMLERNLSWIETLLATDYTKLGQLKDFKGEPHGFTSAMFMANFTQL
jgi:hypothetical protein